MKKPEIKVKVVYEEGYQKRFTEAAIRIYERKAKREGCAIWDFAGRNGRRSGAGVPGP